MVLLRRFLTGLLAFALTQFGVVAMAPAHAHENGGHGVREIVLVQDHTDFEQDHHGSGAGHHEDDHHGDVPEATSDADESLPKSDRNSHGEHAHVHACPQFAPLDAANMAYVPAVYGELVWPVALTPAVRHSSSPPLRPPRATL